jgi:hypothetical protein
MCVNIIKNVLKINQNELCKHYQSNTKVAVSNGWTMSNTVDLFIDYIKILNLGNRYEKATQPIVQHVYQSFFEDHHHKILILMQTYKMAISLQPDEIPPDKFPEILQEIIKKFGYFLKVYIYDISEHQSTIPLHRILYIRMGAANGVLDKETARRINDFIDRESLGIFLKRHSDIVKSDHHLRSYLKWSHPQNRDQVRLWEVLQGLEISDPGKHSITECGII